MTADQPHHAYTLDLARGQFVRIVGTRLGTAFLTLIGPRGDTIGRTYLAVSEDSLPLLLSYTANQTGPHRLEVARFPGDTGTVRYRLCVDELLSPAQRAAREDSMRRDPRAAWLAGHAIPLRSIAPEDDDFTDLEPLRTRIGDARIVLLGEESHASGTSLLALSRVVRFLHQRAGFDVIAFESGLYDMWKVSQRVREGGDPVAAFRQGLLGTWSRSEGFQPLIRYLAREMAGGPRSLEITGIDIQLTGDLSRQRLIPELRQAAAGLGLAQDGGAIESGFWETLARVTSYFYFQHQDSLPERRIQDGVVSGLRWISGRFAERAAVSDDRDRQALSMWAQVAGGLAELVASSWSDLRGERQVENRRDRAMARNLSWLARERFPGRRIIVWAASPHVLRNTHRLGTSAGTDPCCAMGDAIWEEFGSRSFVIATTAYSGQFRWRAAPPDVPAFSVVSDQEPAFELEELMAVSGTSHAVLDLRNIGSGGEWLRSPVSSRAWWNYRNVRVIWPHHADAVLFLRTIAPRTTAADIAAAPPR